LGLLVLFNHFNVDQQDQEPTRNGGAVNLEGETFIPGSAQLIGNSVVAGDNIDQTHLFSTYDAYFAIIRDNSFIIGGKQTVAVALDGGADDFEVSYNTFTWDASSVENGAGIFLRSGNSRCYIHHNDIDASDAATDDFGGIYIRDNTGTGSNASIIRHNTILADGMRGVNLISVTNTNNWVFLDNDITQLGVGAAHFIIEFESGAGEETNIIFQGGTLTGNEINGSGASVGASFCNTDPTTPVLDGIIDCTATSCVITVQAEDCWP
jgi:hypothetical protein